MVDFRATLARLAQVVAEVDGKQNIAAKLKGKLAAVEAEIKTLAAATLRDDATKDQDVKTAEREVSRLKAEIRKKMRRKDTNAGDDDEDDTEDNDAATIARLQTELNNMADDNKELRNAMRHKDVAARAAKATTNKSQKDLESSKEELKTKGFEHQVDLDDKDEELKDKIALVGRLSHSAKVQDARILELDTELHKAKGDLAAIRGTVVTRNSSISFWKGMLPEKEREIQRLEAEKKTARDQHKATVDDLEERRTKTVAEKDRLAEESEETISTLKTELDKVKGEKGKLEEEAKKLKEDLGDSERTIATLCKRVAKQDGSEADYSPASKRARVEG